MIMVSDESRTCYLMDVPMVNPVNNVEESVRVFIPVRIYNKAIAQFIRITYKIAGTDESILALVYNFNSYDKFAMSEDDSFIEICKALWMISDERVEDYQEWLRYEFDIDYSLQVVSALIEY